MATNTSSNEFIVDYDNNYDATTNTFTSSGREFRRSFLLIFNYFLCYVRESRNSVYKEEKKK